MNFIHKRKSTSAAAVKKSVSKIGFGETHLYGANKLTSDEYHELPFISAHMIKDMANPNLSDYFLWRKYVKRNIDEGDRKNTFVLGEAFHTAVLEPKIYDQTYTIQPKFDRRTKVGKEGYAAWHEIHGHKKVVEQENHDAIKAMTAAVKRSKFAKAIMKDCSNEVTAITKLPCGTIKKGRIDSVNLDARYGYDLKSADDVSPAEFAKAAARYRYDIQAYTYMKLFDLDEFLFLVVSKAEPFEVAVYSLNDEYMEKAATDYEIAMDRWRRLNSSMVTPESFIGIDNPMIILAPPKWFFYS